MLLADGAHVTIGSRNAERLAAEADRLVRHSPRPGAARSAGRCATRSTRTRCATPSTFAAEPTGRLDAAVAIAGGGPLAPVLRYSVATLEDTLRRNITSAYLVMKHAGQPHGADRWRIDRRRVVDAGHSARADVRGVLRGEGGPRDARALRGRGARRAPRARERSAGPASRAPTRPPACSPTSDVDRRVQAQQPLDRDGEAEDIAGAIRYFCGPESSWTTGQCLTVDGGTSLRRFPDLADWYRSRIGDEIDRAARGEVD